MTGSRGIAEHVVDMLGDDCRVELRRFFGGWSLLSGHQQIGIVMDTVYAKVAPADRGAWQEAGSLPFSYQARSRTVTVESYWSLPDQAMDDPDLLRALLLPRSSDPTEAGFHGRSAAYEAGGPGPTDVSRSWRPRGPWCASSRP